MIRLSVSSSSRYSASSPLSRSAPTTRLTRFFSLNCRAETLTLTAIGGRPASCQALFCRQASRSTQSPIGTIRPVSSAIGMNLLGGDQAERRVIPADQRLDREDAPGAQVDLRLIDAGRTRDAGDGVAQFLLQQEFLVNLGVQLRRIELEIVAADILGAVHRRVGVGEQRSASVAVVGIVRDADAARHAEVMARRARPARRSPLGSFARSSRNRCPRSWADRRAARRIRRRRAAPPCRSP